ncbi:MAG TPA: DUF1761 domain-containing protein [Anaerolineales bacterium]|jgi:hypothetical protein
MAFTDVNWLAVLVGTVINMFVGFLWYGPLFGQMWMRMIGKRADEIQSDSRMYVVTGVAALVSSYVLAVLIGASGVVTLFGGMMIGIFVWVGIGATGTLVYTTFEGPPRNVWMLHALYQLVVFAINGAIFAVWA